jgi:hypothetical protein
VLLVVAGFALILPLVASASSSYRVEVCGPDPPTATSATVDLPAGTGPGIAQARLSATDSAGNVGAGSDPQLLYDPTAPSTVSFGPSRPSTLGQAQLQIPETLSATAGPSGVYGYQVSVDAAPTGDMSQVQSFGSYDLQNLTTGTHVIYARAFSGAGVPGPVGQITVTVDRDQP